MFRRKVTILFAIIGIAIILGFITGVAPGYFLKSLFGIFFLNKIYYLLWIGYALFGIGLGFLLFIFILLIIITVIFEYLVWLFKNINNLVIFNLGQKSILFNSTDTF